MIDREVRQIKLKFPWLKYLKQIFNSSQYVTIVNPWKFWRRYRIEHLNACYQYNTVEFLERCRQLR